MYVDKYVDREHVVSYETDSIVHGPRLALRVESYVIGNPAKKHACNSVTDI